MKECHHKANKLPHSTFGGQYLGESVLEDVLHAGVVEQEAANNGAKSGVLFLPNPFQHAVFTRFAETEISKTLQADQGVGGACSETGRLL